MSIFGRECNFDVTRHSFSLEVCFFGAACSFSSLAVVLLVCGKVPLVSVMFPGYFWLPWAVFCDFFSIRL